VYEITTQHVFSAAHSVSIAGRPEPLHGHDWHVTATVVAQTLDADGFVCDFHAVHDALVEVCRPYHNQSLNAVTPMADVNPSAENVARLLAMALRERLRSVLPPAARLASVRITEAPGCAALFRFAEAS
jgi:6-pyruvoyltetrahydropterin/6-carboxytetrahydropterin synthase